MSDDVRIAELEQRVNYIVEVLGSLMCSSSVTELSRRVVSLEERFEVNSFDMDNSIRSVYKRQKELYIRKMEEERTRLIRESEYKRLAEDTFEYIAKEGDIENIFRVKDKNITEISSECLYGLTLRQKRYYKTSLDSCFKDCMNLMQIIFPRDFDTSNVRVMECMFYGCSSLSTIDLSAFNTSNVTDMSLMFRECSSLSTLDLSTFNTSNVTDMRCMFYGCSSLRTLNLSTFNTSNVRDM